MTASRILGTYKITYVKHGITQVKNLIRNEDYQNIIKPKQNELRLMELDEDTNADQINVIKRELNDMFGANWFTDNSPLWEANKTGILSLPFPEQGGDHECIIEQITV